MNNKKLFTDICEILDELVTLSNGSVLIKHEKDEIDGVRIWVHILQLPKNEKDHFYFLLPKLDSTINKQLLESFNSGKYYIIDCFDQFAHYERVSDPRLFFINFLFNPKGYNDIFNTNLIFKDIEDLYTKRTISFFNDADSLKNNEHPILENLLETWQVSGKKPLLILGDRGIGKSWTVLNYCLQNYKRHRESPWEHPLPIYLNLRVLSENIPGITNLGELIYYHFINQYEIKIFGEYFLFSILLKTGKIILVLDGLDEMSKEVSNELTIKNIWQIYSVYSNTSKFILTSRINFFHSRIQIKEHFAYQSFQDFNSKKSNYKTEFYNLEERRVRQDFNIWEISPLRNEEKSNLLKRAADLKDEQLDKGLDKLINLSQADNGTIHQELVKLSDIPGYFLHVIKLLATNKFPSLIDIYEQCINSVIIEFNIESDRAISNYKTKTQNKQIEGVIFEAENKNEILRKLAWYMIEREIYEFDIIEFPKFIKEIEDVDFEVVLSDLQTQTVITLMEEGKYSFISDGIFSFYVANYLYILLTKDIDSDLRGLLQDKNKSVLRGLQNIGKYDFIENNVLSKTLVFLKAKIELLKTNPEKLNYIIQKAEEIFQSDRAYSPWLKYLSINLNLIGIEINKSILSKYDFWNNDPISNQNNKVDKKMVLIPGDGPIKPFFLGITEITNKDYSEFLQSNEFDDQDGQEECLGHFWQRSEIFGDDKNKRNPYLDIINYYHIIFWKNDLIPIAKQDHPVVWVSWFAAAKFCNWLSRREQLNPYYTFHLKDKKFDSLTINKEASGYRLPNESEWIYAASGGDKVANTLLDICLDDREKERLNKKFFEGEIETTSPVKSENPNKFGVYGLMGNVREWVDDPEITVLDRYNEQILKGMGWLLGKEGFEFKHRSPLIAQNNNVDVGFRIARSLNSEEERKVNLAYSKTIKK